MSDQALFNSPLEWFPAKSKLTKNLVPIMCKLIFLGHVVEYVTKPVVLSWDKYIKDNQEPLDRHQEEYLSILLQCKLLEGMDRMVEQTSDQYLPSPAETAHFQQFKQKIERAKKNVELMREQLELIKSSDEADAELLADAKLAEAKSANNPTLVPLKRRGGKSKRQRRQRSKRQRQRSKRQRQRQKSKKYYK